MWESTSRASPENLPLVNRGCVSVRWIPIFVGMSGLSNMLLHETVRRDPSGMSACSITLVVLLTSHMCFWYMRGPSVSGHCSPEHVQSGVVCANRLGSRAIWDLVRFTLRPVLAFASMTMGGDAVQGGQKKARSSGCLIGQPTSRQYHQRPLSTPSSASTRLLP